MCVCSDLILVWIGGVVYILMTVGIFVLIYCGIVQQLEPDHPACQFVDPIVDVVSSSFFLIVSISKPYTLNPKH